MPDLLPQSQTRAPAPLFVACLTGLIVTAGLAFLPAMLNDGDTFMHVRIGVQMIANGEIFHVDAFSRSVPGRPWQVHEWLAEIVLGFVWLKAGFAGVMLVSAGAIGLAAGIMAHFLARRLEWIYAVLAVIAGLATAAHGFLARPHVLAYPFMVAIAAELFSAAEAGRRPRLLILAPAFWLWANLHGSFVIGLALIGVAGLEAVIAARGQWLATALTWGMAGLVSTLATVLGPHGVETLVFPLLHAANAGLANIGEWQPADFSKFSSFEIVLALTVLVLSRGVTVPLPRLAFLLLIIHMSVLHMRHQQLFGLLAPLLLAAPIAVLRPAAPSTPGLPRPAAGGLVLLATLLVAIRLMLPMPVIDGPTTPVTALGTLPAEMRGQPVVNDYAFGAYLIFQDIPPYIDSRAELYGPEMLADYARLISDRCRLAAVLTESSAGWTIFSPQTAASRFMDGMPGWQRLYADRFAVIHIRDGAAPSGLPKGCAAPAG